MGFSCGVGYSDDRNPNIAGRDAATAALQSAGITEPDLILLFSTVGYKQHIIYNAVRQTAGNAPIFGCSGEGIIFRDKSVETNFSVAVAVIKSDEYRFATASSLGLKENSNKVGRSIGSSLKDTLRGANPLGLLTFADGLTMNYDQLLSGLMDEMSPGKMLPHFGGTAADNWKFEGTYQYTDKGVCSDAATCALIYGSGKLVYGVKHGCVPVGDERTVTRSVANRIHEIDGKPALQVINEYLSVAERNDDWQKTNVYLSIGIKAPEFMRGYDDYMIRFMPMRDEADGSVYVPTEIAEGTRFYMTRRDFDKIAQGNQNLVEEIKSQLSGNLPRFVLQIECGGRGKIIFKDEEKQSLLKLVQQGIDPQGVVPWIGVYTYGEFSPVQGVNCFHNYSNVLICFQ